MMTEREELRRRLEFYRDLGIRELHVRAAPEGIEETVEPIVEAAQAPVEPEAPRLEPPPPSRPLPPPPRARITSPPVVAAATPPPLLSMAPENDSLPRILEEIGDCTRCKLHKGRTKLVFGAGNPEAKLVFVGEGPGADEDAQGLPFVGRAGQLLTQMIEGTSSKEGIPIKRPDVYICNVVKCRPPENRTPLPPEVSACSPYLTEQLNLVRPEIVVALGRCASEALGCAKPTGSWRGMWGEWQSYPVMSTYHPAFLLRSPEFKRQVWDDLQKVMERMGLKKGAGA